MSAYTGNILGIKNGLLSLLQGIQLDGGSGPEDAFGLVTDDPSLETSKEPYCLVIPNDFEDEHVEVGVNDYSIPFIVIILLSLESKQRTQPETYDYMYNLSELVLNTLDQADWTDALNTDTGLNTYLLDTSKVQIRPAESKAGAVLLARIDVTVKYQYSLT